MWSPDGGHIAFYSFRSGQRQIWVMPAAGGLARQLTDGDRDANFPGWSADSGEVVFTSISRGHVFAVPGQGGTERQLTNDSLGCNAGFPQWSPDGSWLAFFCASEQGDRLWVMSASGDAKQLSDRESYYPRWSRDGMEIYFFGEDEGGWEIWAVPVDGKRARPMTALSGRRGVIGNWGLATDENFIYFTWKDDIGDIWVMDVVTDESE